MKSFTACRKCSMGFVVWLLLGPTVWVEAGENPIIFVHGIKTDPATAREGHKTWNPEDGYPTAMTRIISSAYAGYRPGTPLNCQENTAVEYMPDTKRIYNFSYYHSDGTAGVIGKNSILKCMYVRTITGRIKHRDDLTVSDLPIRDAYSEAASGGSW